MKVRLFVLAIAIIATFLFVFNSCKHEVVSLEEMPVIDFNTQVLPIFQTNCAYSGCHDGSGEVFDLSNYDAIIKNITKGKPESSQIYSAITSSWVNVMPPDKPLTADQRTIIRLWIIQGANPSAQETNTSNIPTNTGTGGGVCFSRDILPVLQTGCARSKCHDASSAKEGVVITSYDNVMHIVSAGKPNSSMLYHVISTTNGDRMPPSPDNPMSHANIDSIYNWINNGAKNETCTYVCDTLKFGYAAQVFPIIDNYCNTCHSFKTYKVIADTAKNGALLGVLKKTGNYPLMPKYGSLSACKITIIEKWIAAGAMEN